jgi:hypothetical protein
MIPPNTTLIYDVELITFSSVGNVERLLREKRATDPYALIT